MKKETHRKIRKNYGAGLAGFEHDDQIVIAQIAEHAILKWTIELSDALDISFADLGKLKVKLTEYLDEEEY